MTKLFSQRKVSLDTQVVYIWKRKITQLQRKNKALKTTITHLKNHNEKEKKRLHERSVLKAKNTICQTIYRPKRRDVRIHAKILLVPVKEA